MSSGAGGDVAVVAVAGAVAAPIVVAAGLALGAGYCAVGIAKAGAAAGRAASRAWADHEHARELQARQLQLEQERFSAYLRAVAAYDSACADTGREPGSPADRGLRADSEVKDLQEATAQFEIAAARMRREADARAAVAAARALESSLRHTADSEAVVAGEVLAARARQLDEAAAVELARQSRRVQAEVAAARARLEAAAAAAREERARRRIAAALADMPADLPGDLADRVSTWIARMPELADGSWEQAALDLEKIAGSAQSAAAQRRQADQTAAAVVAALAGCTTPTAAEVTRRAQEYLAGRADWDPHLVDKARAELERIQAQFDSLRAAEVLADSLVELGYEVGPDFITEAAGASGAFAHRQGWEEHAVNVRLGGERLAIQVVREGDPRSESTQAQRREDIEVERRFCDDLDDMLEASRRSGVAVDLTTRIEPGELEIDRVADTGRGRRAATKRADRTREVSTDE